jgi:G:T/U-mismatch repair DNA glycosylase
MKYNTKVEALDEPLPWEPYVPLNANKLILGTFPTHEKNWDFNFYYPNKNNPMWKILSAIAKTDLTHSKNEITSVNERKAILDKLNLAMTDMGKVIRRQKVSSLDIDLFPIEFIDVFNILDKYPSIQTIILTSSTKGNSVLSWFKSYCTMNNKKIKLKGKGFPRLENMTLNGREIKIVLVCSTSGATGKTYDFLLDLYRKVIF